jgi:heterotetrameric sarcosine oxidase gamma subunit
MEHGCMFDRAEFWSAVPAWRGAVLQGVDVRVTLIETAAVFQLSGAPEAVRTLARVATIHGPRDPCEGERYALRLAPDSVLLVDTARTSDPGEVQPGWHDDGVAVTDLTDGMLCIEITGQGARELLALGTEYPFDAPPAAPHESARVLFAGFRVAVARRADGWRLHVERPWAPALWHWLAGVRSSI